MKNKISIGIIMVFINSAIIAQNTKEPPLIIKEDTTVKVKKNELGIDLIPGIKRLSGNSYTNNIFQVGLQYKRRISKRMYFRFGITELFYLNQNDIYRYSTSNPWSMPNHFNYSKYKVGPETRLNTGMEYRWGKKRVKFFTGMDFCYSSIKSITDFYVSTTYHDPYHIAEGDSLIRSSLYMRNTFGLLPFIGMQYHFSTRFFFSMQFGTNIRYNFHNDAGTKHQDYNILDDILNNFSLFYKF